MYISSIKKEILFLIATLVVFLTLVISSIFSESRTFDETPHIQAGYAFLTQRDFMKEPFNPPLARELIAIPSVINPATLNDPLYISQRLVVIFIGCIFILVFYLTTKSLMGIYPAMCATVLILFEPEILAHSHYATTDFILTFFVYLAIMLPIVWRKQLTTFRISIIGICIGLALASKISALPFIAISYCFLGVFYVFRRGIKKIYPTKNKLLQLFLLVSCCFLTTWATYSFTTEAPLGKGFTPHNKVVKQLVRLPLVKQLVSEPIPLGGYLRTIKQVVLYNYSSEFNKSAFLMGHMYEKGVWYFYPIAFLLKTPLPFLIALLLAFRLDKQKKYTFLLLPVIAMLLPALVSTLNLGIRYILPMYPFLIMYVASVAYFELIAKRRYMILVCILFAWYVSGTLVVFPHYLSFMNEFTGREKYHFLIDSNYDWGQGLVELARYQKKNNVKSVQLAYFGLVDPHIYGITYSRVGDLNFGDKTPSVKLQTDKENIVVISASCYYLCGYYKQPVFANKKPEIIGNSMLLFHF